MTGGVALYLPRRGSGRSMNTFMHVSLRPLVSGNEARPACSTHGVGVMSSDNCLSGGTGDGIFPRKREARRLFRETWGVGDD